MGLSGRKGATSCETYRILGFSISPYISPFEIPTKVRISSRIFKEKIGRFALLIAIGHDAGKLVFRRSNDPPIGLFILWSLFKTCADHTRQFLTGSSHLERLSTHREILDRAREEKKKGRTVGFVPTMGALHEGHLELVRKGRDRSDTLISSIFVNPEQFNDPTDFTHYPRSLEKDLALLEQEECDIVYTPPEKEVYRDREKPAVDLGGLDETMEGVHRPGHFTGVMMVVERLFRSVEPDKAFFGKKDYQQLLIVKEMVRQLELPITIVPCPTVRESDGLAVSSRNRHLDPQQRSLAKTLYQTLDKVYKDARKKNPEAPPTLKARAFKEMERTPGIEPEYFEIRDKECLRPLSGWDEKGGAIALVAAWVGKVRLIDNLELDR